MFTVFSSLHLLPVKVTNLHCGTPPSPPHEFVCSMLSLFLAPGPLPGFRGYFRGAGGSIALCRRLDAGKKLRIKSELFDIYLSMRMVMNPESCEGWKSLINFIKKMR